MEAGGWEISIPSVLYVNWPEVVDGFKEGLYGVVQDCFESSLLIIDDIGAEHDPSKNAADKVCQILSKREHKFNVITTNVHQTSWSNKFDMRIADRLLRNSVVVDLSDIESHSL